MTGLPAIHGETGSLLRVEEACKLLAECRRVDEAKSIRDKAGAVAAYLRQQRASAEAQNDAAEIKLRAERRLGELLADQEKNKGGGDTRKHHSQRASGDAPPPLRDLGITHSQSARWQDIAKVPEEKFEAFIADTRAKSGEVTTSGLRREHVAEVKRVERIAKLGEISRKSQPLDGSLGRFPILYADPPWQYDDSTTDPTRQIENQYPTMSVEEICAMPVLQVCTDDCVLFLWATNPLLPEAMRVLAAWGFTYKSNFAWDKEIAGTGYWNRGQHELLLVATRGEPPKPPTGARSASVQKIRRGEHSQKPEQFYMLIERAYPTLPKLELFARTARAEWASWGNQAPGAA